MTGAAVPDGDRLDHRVLLTGATGRVGARFLPLLRHRGARLRLMVWNPLSPPAPTANPDLVVGDLTDPDTCRRAVAGMDAVIHIASAFVGVDAARAEELNYVATARLAAAALDAGVPRFIQMSSYLVYRPTPGRPAREDDLLRAPDGAPFSAAKLGSERAVAEFTGTSLGVCVLRLAFTYGEGDPHLVDALAWARRSSAGQRLHLVHHADVRQSVLHSLRIGAAGIYNIADDAPVRAAELATIAADIDGDGDGVPGHAESAAAAQFDGDQFGGEVDTAAARTGLGFKPTYPSIQAAKRAGAM
jgi:nucleoside-diphosphate-sugar epimerase